MTSRQFVEILHARRYKRYARLVEMARQCDHIYYTALSDFMRQALPERKDIKPYMKDMTLWICLSRKWDKYRYSHRIKQR